ncbi:SDR family NAD(P)-dependent oxidoreductase [Acinetobacter radioresistens]|uniref:SDR family NAD(P)-dependent oxidoreductase n=1 Tax=Acinetobacter radioresistens TaxID=40216 RepID=UPI00224706BE|nr:SDR family NAD(P)-dependent oxidoreductase [Acinetobacter radioresistens]MCX0332528.1 SDR family NAD(P)-dependent oxidoreductase [Acinetobacter radioresistens]
MRKRIVVVGATSSIAEHCLRIWSTEQPNNFVLLGRNLDKLDLLKGDLLVRQPLNTVEVIQAEFLDPNAIQDLVKLICAAPVDIVLIAQGILPEQQEYERDLSLISHNIEINGLSPILFAEAFYQYMQYQSTGTIAVFSSVAGERGRKSNYIYGAAKGLVTRYVEGMQHKAAIKGNSVKICLIKPGPTESAMTLHLKKQGVKLAPTQKVASNIVKGIKKQQRVIYTPAIWSLIMFIISNLPFILFKKMDI